MRRRQSWFMDLRPLSSGQRRGSILFEVVLAVALFVGAAAYTLAAVRSVFTTLDQTRRRQEAVDLARSKLAELEAGLISLNDLREGGTGASFADGRESANRGGKPVSGGDAKWVFDVKVHRSEFTDLTLVELTVREESPVENDSNAMSFTLRQLMALRQSKTPGYQQDEMLEKLPPATTKPVAPKSSTPKKPKNGGKP